LEDKLKVYLELNNLTDEIRINYK